MPKIMQFPRAVRPAPEPLALYFRPGRNDHRVLSDLIAGGDIGFFGAVLDPTNLSRQGELRDQLVQSKVDLILDPKTQEAAAPGRYTDSLGRLPWINGQITSVEDFQGVAGRRRIADFASFASDEGFTKVIAPSHLLTELDDGTCEANVALVNQLREQLTKTGQGHKGIIYSLAIPYKWFRKPECREKIIECLRSAPIDELWLKVAGTGANATATGVRNYIQAAADFHSLGVPVVADFMGGLAGLSLLAFGSVGGIAHGITFGERFDTSAWAKPSPKSSFGRKRRVYLPKVDMMLDPVIVERLFEAYPRAKAQFGCEDHACCRKSGDTIGNPARHFMIQRIKDVSGLSAIPEQIRPMRFLESKLRRASDLAVALAGLDIGDKDFARQAERNRKRLDALRVALSEQASKHPPRSFSQHPKTRASRE